MSTFSFSAPVITTEQEKVERDNLSSEELSAVDADVHGRKVPGAFEENETLRQTGPSLFAEALEALPEDVNKREYLEALEQCPEIVEQEMDPIVFLRSQDFDAHVRFIYVVLGISCSGNVLQQSLISLVLSELKLTCDYSSSSYLKHNIGCR